MARCLTSVRNALKRGRASNANVLNRNSGAELLDFYTGVEGKREMP
jgi:hypothetical protein